MSSVAWQPPLNIRFQINLTVVATDLYAINLQLRDSKKSNEDVYEENIVKLIFNSVSLKVVRLKSQNELKKVFVFTTRLENIPP
jgi:hypothetical protein